MPKFKHHDDRPRTHVDRGRQVPAIVASGPPITTPGGHCWAMGGEAARLGELHAAVRERAERGADLIKIMASGGVLTAGTDLLACQYSLESCGPWPTRRTPVGWRSPRTRTG